MSFSDKTLTTLEFDKICDLLAACAATEGAKELCRRLMPSDDAVEVARRPCTLRLQQNEPYLYNLFG